MIRAFKLMFWFLFIPLLKMICITSSPGFNFYWFFKYDVNMENLSNEISKVVADVQISGGSKLQKIF